MPIMYMQALCSCFSHPLHKTLQDTQQKIQKTFFFLKVCKKLTVQDVAYRKQPNIQEWHCCKSNFKDLLAI